MRARGVAASSVAVLVGLAMAGCNSAVAGSPSATATQSESTGGTSTERLSPPVEHPKDLRGIDPCEFLTPEQKAALRLTEPGERDISPWGEEKCFLKGSVVTIGFSPNTKLGEGLDQAYRAKDSFDNFAESEVDGYPAARVNVATQLCGVIVGVSDEQTLNMSFGRVSSDAPGSGDPCGFAESVMGDVIKNLPDA